MAEESKFLAFKGIRVHFTMVRPDVPLRGRMLLLCSPLMTTFHWRKLIPELEQLGILTVLADFPGFGKSECSGDVPQDTQTRASILWGILDHVDASTQSPMSTWHLAGHSIACPTILRMAAQYPDSVRSQIHFSPLFTSERLFKKVDAAQKWLATTVQSERRFADFTEKYSCYELDDYILDRMRMPLLRPGAEECFLRMVKETRSLPEEGMGFCPTMALWGGQDPYMTDAALEDIKTLLPEAETHVLRSAGHLPMETHSRALRDYLRGWIRYNDEM